ncbi:hypothetical protein COO60DRAFT_840591 [Scenedesmus sp. NREL 46B-D3]|nr:hypothetical protein COO60DRAFT_840591 [Scenedesmus sp. NREL 46B-D3]
MDRGRIRCCTVRASLFVAAAEVLLKQQLSDVRRHAQDMVQRSSNCAEVLLALSAALPGVDLFHISPCAVVAGDLQHVSSLMQLLAELSHMPEGQQQKQQQQRRNSQPLAAGKAQSPASRGSRCCRCSRSSSPPRRPRITAAAADERLGGSDTTVAKHEQQATTQQLSRGKQRLQGPSTSRNFSANTCSSSRGGREPSCMPAAVPVEVAALGAAAAEQGTVTSGLDTHWALQQLQQALSCAGHLLRHHSQGERHDCSPVPATADGGVAAVAASHQKQQLGCCEELSLPCDMRDVALALKEMQAVNMQLQRLEQHLQLDQTQLEQQQQLGVHAPSQEQWHQQWQLQHGQPLKQPCMTTSTAAVSAGTAICPLQCSEAAASAGATTAASNLGGPADVSQTSPLPGAAGNSRVRLLHLHQVTKALLAGVQDQQDALRVQQQEAVLLCKQAEAAAAAAATAAAIATKHRPESDAGRTAAAAAAAASAATESGWDADPGNAPTATGAPCRGDGLAGQLQAAEQQQAAVQASVLQMNAMALQLQATERQLLEQQRQILERCSELAPGLATSTQQALLKVQQQDKALSDAPPEAEAVQNSNPLPATRLTADDLVRSSGTELHAEENCSIHSRSSCKAGSSPKHKTANQQQAQKAALQGLIKGQHDDTSCRPTSAHRQMQQRCSISWRSSMEPGLAAGGSSAAGRAAAAGPQLSVRSGIGGSAAALLKRKMKPAARPSEQVSSSQKTPMVAKMPDAVVGVSPLHHHHPGRSCDSPGGGSGDSSWAGSSRAWNAGVHAVSTR